MQIGLLSPLLVGYGQTHPELSCGDGRCIGPDSLNRLHDLLERVFSLKQNGMMKNDDGLSGDCCRREI